ncbi:MAG: acyl carrier protein [bacterium]
MDAETIAAKMKKLIVERLFLDVTPEAIETDTPLAEYGVDSFLLLEVIVGIEEEFGIKIEQSDIRAETLRSVGTLTELVLSKQG